MGYNEWTRSTSKKNIIVFRHKDTFFPQIRIVKNRPNSSALYSLSIDDRVKINGKKKTYNIFEGSFNTEKEALSFARNYMRSYTSKT